MKQTILKKFGKRVRQLRQERGLTQEKLADKCGLDMTFIGHIERAEQNSSVVTAAQLAKGLDIPLEVLFKGL